MEITLRLDKAGEKTVIRLFKDPKSPRSYKEFTCIVTTRGQNYRSDILASELQEFLLFLKSSVVPVKGECGFGIDGISYELTIENDFACSSFKWWMNPEAGWTPLMEIVRKLMSIGHRISGQYL
jgi:hypothetical protein